MKKIIQILCLAIIILACNKSDVVPTSKNTSEEYEVDAQLTINKITKSGKNYSLFCKVEVVSNFPSTESAVTCTWTKP
jgi:hypothetical protein